MRSGPAWIRHVRQYKVRLAFIAVVLAYFAVYKYGPMYGLIIAFQDYQIGAGFTESPWVGLEHFRSFLENPDFTRVFWNTALISAYRIAFGFFPPVVLALLLNEVMHRTYQRWIQTLTYLPHFLSWVIIYGMAFAFLSEGRGLVNEWIRGWGGQSINFLTSEAWFRSLLVISDIWKDTGWGAIIYLAAIFGINPQLYEAAITDGAGRWRQIWHITLPGIAPVIILLFILRLGHVLDAGMEQVLVFYNPLVYSVGDILDTWAYRMGILEGRFSLAAAVGLFKSVVGLLLVFAANRLANRWGDGGIW